MPMAAIRSMTARDSPEPPRPAMGHEGEGWASEEIPG